MIVVIDAAESGCLQAESGLSPGRKWPVSSFVAALPCQEASHAQHGGKILMTRFDDEAAVTADVTHGNSRPEPVSPAKNRDVTDSVNVRTERLAAVSTLEQADDCVNTAAESSWVTRFDEGLTRISTAKGAKPVRALGGFFAMALDTFVLIPRRPFAWREFLLQCWFVARVSLLPTMLLAIPLDVLLIFTFNILIMDFGAADYSGTGAAWGTVTQVGPVVTVLVVSGAGATAMCADLGARTIREELDALRVMGVNPIQALVVPRVLAATVVATLLSSVVILVGLIGCFVFSVYVQHVVPGSFVASLTTITHAADLIVSWIKASVFGLSAGLIACYKGISVGGGPAGVGIAVNETVVFTFVALFAVNIIATAVGVKVTI
jgi:phospholipid/cholesterol/gamma-HCH transport system permease protein